MQQFLPHWPIIHKHTVIPRSINTSTMTEAWSTFCTNSVSCHFFSVRLRNILSPIWNEPVTNFAGATSLPHNLSCRTRKQYVTASFKVKTEGKKLGQISTFSLLLPALLFKKKNKINLFLPQQIHVSFMSTESILNRKCWCLTFYQHTITHIKPHSLEHTKH